MRKKRAMQREARLARPRRVNETPNSASSAAGKSSANERNKQCSERRRGQDREKSDAARRAGARHVPAKETTTQRAARRASRLARRQPVKQMTDAMSGAASNLLDILCNKTLTPPRLTGHCHPRENSKNAHETNVNCRVVDKNSRELQG
jgi:hypothetical protein